MIADQTTTMAVETKKAKTDASDDNTLTYDSGMQC